MTVKIPCKNPKIQRVHYSSRAENNCKYCTPINVKSHTKQLSNNVPIIEENINRGDAPIFSDIKDRKERTQAVLEELNKGIENLDTKEKWEDFLKFRSRSRNYSLNNTMLMMIQYPEFSDVRTAKQWEGAGLGSVKKGEKAIWLLRPQPFYKDKTDQNGQPVLDAKGKPIKEKAGVYYISYPAFDVKQINDPDNIVPEMPSVENYLASRREEDAGAEGMFEDLKEVAAANNIEIIYEEFPERERMGGYAHKNPATGKSEIRINTRNATQGSQAKTLAHELGHVLGGHLEDSEMHNYHSSGGERDRGDYEAEAESFAYVLAQEYGVRNMGNRSFEYIDSWAKGDTKKIHGVGDRVMKSSGKFFKSLEKIKIGKTVEEINAENRENNKRK